MASLSIEPFSRFEFSNNFNSRILFFNTPFPTISVFNFSCSNKLENSRISVSFQNPLNPKIIKKKCIFRLPVSPFSQFLASFQHLRSSMAFNFRNSVKKWDFRSRGTRDEDTENLEFLQNGGIGMALLSVTATAKVRISPLMATLAANPTFVSGVLAWAIAQSVKMFLNFFLERKWDFRVLFASGGMPSSHSALCTALTTSVALCHGVADSLFPVCLGFSSIVMYDAIGVRRHAGMQAEVLNMIIADLFQGHPISQRKLKELLGHTPSQVLAGAVLGILVACICCQGCLVAA